MFGVELFVISVRDGSGSFGVGMFCRASMVEDVGVFSPRIAFSGGRFTLGVGVPERVGLLSGDLVSKSNIGVRGSRSGELPGVRPLSREPSAST